MLSPQALLLSFFPEHLSDMMFGFLIEREWLQETIKKFVILDRRRKMVPLITCETAFRQHVSKLVLGINILVWDFGVTKICGFWIRVSS